MDKPWRHRPEWADGRVKEQSHQRVGWVIGRLFCLLWFGGLGATFSFLPPPFGPDGVGPSAFVLVVVAAGLVPQAFTIGETRAALSAPAVFEMATFPGVIGGALRGRAVFREPSTRASAR